MPCYTRQLTSVELTMLDKDLLWKALKELGFSVLSKFSNDRWEIKTPNGLLEINFKTKKVIYDSRNKRLVEDINKLKRKYSEITTKEKAKANKWIIKQSSEKRIELWRY